MMTQAFDFPVKFNVTDFFGALGGYIDDALKAIGIDIPSFNIGDTGVAISWAVAIPVTVWFKAIDQWGDFTKARCWQTQLR